MADQRLIPAGIKDDSTLAINDLIDRIGALDLTPLLIYIIDNVTGTALPHLLEQFHVAGKEGGTLAENDTNRRTLIQQAIALHRIKGTPAGLKKAISDAGFGGVTLIERTGDLRYNGEANYNSVHTYGTAGGGWALYSLVIDRPITNDQAAMLADVCSEFAPVRCHLYQIIYTEAPIRYNSTAQYDGTYNYGAAGV